MRSAFSPLARRSTIFFGISGAPAAISLRARATSRALPISSSASAALAASASYSLRGRMAISPLSVFLKRTFMVLVLSVVDFPAVADRHDDAACRSLPSLEGPAKVVDCEAALDRDDGG